MKSKSKKKHYTKASTLKDISSRVDYNAPLDLNTILEMSRKGLLKESSKKIARASIIRSIDSRSHFFSRGIMEGSCR